MTLYLDYHAHSPIDPRVLATLVEAYGFADANPHSTHRHGAASHILVEQARVAVASLLGCRTGELVFTSGATEANNLALLGPARHLLEAGRDHILVSDIEHPSVLESAAALSREGFVVECVPVTTQGLVDPGRLRSLMRDRTGLVSVAWANHEIGAVQDMRALSQIVRSAGAYLHSDMAQAAGKVPVDVGLLDLGSISAHKMGGPTGIGALFVSRRLRPKLQARAYGGGQEGGLRSGTVPTPLCAAFGEAATIAKAEMDAEATRLGKLRDLLIEGLTGLPGSWLNGPRDNRLPGNVHVGFDDVDGEALAIGLQDQLSISTGSACNAHSLEPSPVLLSIGLPKQKAEMAVRIGLGRTTTRQDVDVTVAAFRAVVSSLRGTRSRL